MDNNTLIKIVVWVIFVMTAFQTGCFVAVICSEAYRYNVVKKIEDLMKFGGFESVAKKSAWRGIFQNVVVLLLLLMLLSLL